MRSSGGSFNCMSCQERLINLRIFREKEEQKHSLKRLLSVFYASEEEFMEICEKINVHYLFPTHLEHLGENIVR